MLNKLASRYFFKFGSLARKILRRGIIFTLLIVFLGFIVGSIFHTNYVVETFSNDDFRNRQVVRVAMQVRPQLMKALWGCHEAAHDHANNFQNHSDICLTALEAALAQVSSELYLPDRPQLRVELEEIYEMAQKALEMKEKKAKPEEIEDELEMFSNKVLVVFDGLGTTEANMWSEGSTRYSNLIRDFKVANRFSLVSVALVFLFIVYFVILNLLKERADRRLAKAQEDIEAQRLALIQSSKMSLLGEMASGVAHEINNPLAIIYSKAENLQLMSQENRLSHETLMKSTDKILTMTMRITKIIRGLRSFARDGESDPFVPTSVESVIGDTVELCRSRLSSHSVELIIEQPSHSVMVDCRSTQISQVILNLVHNSHDAIESMSEGKWIKIKAQEIGDEVKISVIDCGSGIPKEVQEKMFNPFYTTKDVGKGTGLGLSISTGIIRAHKGRIEVDRDCKNTSISFTLPKAQIQSGEQAA